MMTQEKKKEQDLPDVTEDKKDLMEWIKAHKKQLILIGISLQSLGVIVLGLKNKDAMIELLNNLKDVAQKADLYGNKWFEKATDAELDAAREKVRLAYCSSGDDFKAACGLQNLLGKFDKELSKRAWSDEIPHAPSIHREHGWYLPNDD